MTDGPVVVVANPTAGRGKAGRLIGRVDGLLRAAGVDHRVELSTSAADLTDRARRAAEAGAPVVAALGGDGTVGLAANGLVGTDAALAILPSGTADDFAAAIGVGSLDKAIRALAAGVTERIDVARVTADGTSRYMVNVAGCGFDSEVNEAANAMRVNLGATGTYVAAVIRTLARFQPATFTVTVDDEVVRGPHMLVVVGNSTRYGGGMKVTPDASLVDGALDVCLLRALSKGAFLRAFPGVFRGAHVRHPAVRMMRGARITIEADRRVLVYADGERIGPAPVTLEIVPGALTVIVGPNPAAIR
ncbi:MAG TPA: diacylglycerol kinase family protein [Actinomycetota bacterium]|nr:diacylglycerol kinase family protein [Actinomycetota bacterium]